jgi:hypothetical protein
MARPSPRYLTSLALLGLVGSCRGGEVPSTLGDSREAGPPGVRVVFPRRNVVVTPALETLPVVMEGASGAVAHLVVDDAVAQTVTLEGGFVTVRLPVGGEAHRVTVVATNRDGVLEPVGSFHVQVMGQEAAGTVQRRQAEGAAAGKAGETGDGALDFGTIPTGPFDAYVDDQPPHVFLAPEVLCLTDVDVHRPISQDDDEPLVPELQDFVHGAYTLRNDDADWSVGASVATDELPVSAVATDVDQAPNPRENDLVRVDAHNLLGLPGTYLFAFPLASEASRDVGAHVNPGGGRQATAAELGWWRGATKGGADAGLPRPIPQGETTTWVEGLLGGRYRLVLGVVPSGTNPAAVRYDAKTATTTPALGCMRQATVTVVVADIFQGASPRRLTAFDVYWGGRPYFDAEVWPPGGQYQWAAPYKLGGGPAHVVPGQAVTGEVAYMDRDATEDEPRTGAGQRGHKVVAQGIAKGADKVRLHGGIRVDRPTAVTGQGRREPAVGRDPANRYPDRISLAYTVDGERLVRPEPLEVILPQLHAVPPARLVEGDTRTVDSRVEYAIDDAFQRRIRARSVPAYLELYGSGLKAWEALGTDVGTREAGPRHDDLALVTVGQGLHSLPLGTAQRSQAAVHPDRMTAGGFRDSLHFAARPSQNDRKLDWQAWTGFLGNAAYAAQRQAAADRAQDYRRARGNARSIQRLEAQDAASATRYPLFAIPQDVILQLRSGDDRDDLMVLEGSMLTVYAPRFFEVFPTAARPGPLHFHLRFTPGTVRSELVDANRRRTPP